MSEWRGLHNPERHFPEQGEPTRAWCATCDGRCDEGLCDRDDPCHCCLATEVETLRAELRELGLLLDRRTAENEVLRAQVERLPRFDCDPSFPLCDDEPCQGHRLTPEVDLVARVLAIKEGWDRLEDSDQTEDYWRAAAELVAAIEEAQP